MPIIHGNHIVVYLKKLTPADQIWLTKQQLDGNYTVAPSYPATLINRSSEVKKAEEIRIQNWDSAKQHFEDENVAVWHVLLKLWNIK